MSYELRKAALKKGAAKFAERGFGKLAQKSGFTLAEMMVVMLIMSIIMAAFAPVVTTRNKSGDNSERWRWARNRSDIYYGIADTQVAMIGQNEREATDPSSKLLISTIEDGQNHILFKHATSAGAGTILGQLYMDDKGNYGLTTSQLKGSQNTAFGSGALINVTGSGTGDNGTKNTAIGFESLKSNTGGYYNTAVGELSLTSNTTGWRNVAIGNSSMRSNTSGQENVGIGADSLYHNLSGSNNVAVGQSALTLNQTGNSNVAVGYHALYSNDNGYNNVAIGLNPLVNNTGGYYNIAIGERSLEANTTGIENTAVGTYSSLYTSGSHNTALGYDSLRDMSGDYNTAVGYRTNFDDANHYHSGSYTTALGANASAFNSYATALGALSHADAEGATAGGYNSTASGQYSTAYGNLSRATNTYATAIGDVAEATAERATAVGQYAYARSQYSIAIGSDVNASNSEAIAIGYMANASGSQSIAIGTLGTSVGTTASGQYSIAMGDGAMARGQDNIAIGREACANVYGSNKVCIGANSGPSSGSSWASSSDSQERIFIGSKSKFNNRDAVLEVHNTSETMKSNAWIYGGINASGVVINGSLIVRGPIFTASHDNNTGMWNHSYNTSLGIVGHYGSDPNNSVGEHFLVTRKPHTSKDSPESFDPLLYNSSDRRLKYVGSENKNGLDKIRELKVFNYTFKKDKNKTPHVGVIAQDLQKVFPDAVTKGEDGFLRIRLEDMFYAAINAIKELATRMDRNEQKIKQLEQENKELKARLERLEKALK